MRKDSRAGLELVCRLRIGPDWFGLHVEGLSAAHRLGMGDNQSGTAVAAVVDLSEFRQGRRSHRNRPDDPPAGAGSGSAVGRHVGLPDVWRKTAAHSRGRAGTAAERDFRPSGGRAGRVEDWRSVDERTFERRQAITRALLDFTRAFRSGFGGVMEEALLAVWEIEDAFRANLPSASAVKVHQLAAEAAQSIVWMVNHDKDQPTALTTIAQRVIDEELRSSGSRAEPHPH